MGLKVKSKIIFTIIQIVLLSFLSPNISEAQNTKFDSLVKTGINQIYNIKFETADSTFSQLEKEFPKSPAGKFFKAMIIWWHIMLDRKNESYDDLFEEKLEEVIDFCDEILDEDDRNVDAIFFKGGSLGFRGRLYSLRKEWFDAALDGKDALPLVYEAFEIDSTNEDVKLGFGIYNYYAEAIPEKYPFIKPAMIFFPGGDKIKGINQLNAAAANSKFASVEARFFLMTLYYQFENDYDKALLYGETLSSDFPDNPIFQKYLARIYVKKGNYVKACSVFADIEKSYKNKKRGYNNLLLREAKYYLGVNLLQKNKVDSSRISFEKCVELSKELDKNEESGFRINSVLYLGKIADQKNEKELAKKYYKQLLEMRVFSNSHNKAKKYLDKNN